ncbi:uncharacterized protein LOC125947284 [Dermacentor silvarum]|uniref:uncharacterized protein LOC125942235 n=1 Tax=Dermacentor silvarum TaxID=543639 RepID=UPI00210075D7|nr:uncharacterized protein LOC125942235 [Dermacentor silvarum]XP_049527660.1 uncharacterized protein LOC125947284 [Dermacentor silvarum]
MSRKQSAPTRQKSSTSASHKATTNVDGYFEARYGLRRAVSVACGLPSTCCSNEKPKRRNVARRGTPKTPCGETEEDASAGTEACCAGYRCEERVSATSLESLEPVVVSAGRKRRIPQGKTTNQQVRASQVGKKLSSLLESTASTTRRQAEQPAVLSKNVRKRKGRSPPSGGAAEVQQGRAQVKGATQAKRRKLTQGGQQRKQGERKGRQENGRRQVVDRGSPTPAKQRTRSASKTAAAKKAALGRTCSASNNKASKNDVSTSNDTIGPASQLHSLRASLDKTPLGGPVGLVAHVQQPSAVANGGGRLLLNCDTNNPQGILKTSATVPGSSEVPSTVTDILLSFQGMFIDQDTSGTRPESPLSCQQRDSLNGDSGIVLSENPPAQKRWSEHGDVLEDSQNIPRERSHSLDCASEPSLCAADSVRVRVEPRRQRQCGDDDFPVPSTSLAPPRTTTPEQGVRVERQNSLQEPTESPVPIPYTLPLEQRLAQVLDDTIFAPAESEAPPAARRKSAYKGLAEFLTQRTRRPFSLVSTLKHMPFLRRPSELEETRVAQSVSTELGQPGAAFLPTRPADDTLVSQSISSQSRAPAGDEAGAASSGVASFENPPADDDVIVVSQVPPLRWRSSAADDDLVIIESSDSGSGRRERASDTSETASPSERRGSYYNAPAGEGTNFGHDRIRDRMLELNTAVAFYVLQRCREEEAAWRLLRLYHCGSRSTEAYIAEVRGIMRSALERNRLQGNRLTTALRTIENTANTRCQNAGVMESGSSD